MKVNKKLVIVCLLVVMVLGLWKGCEMMANRELLESITLYEMRQESFEKMYESCGKVVCQKQVRMPVEGMIVEVLVQVGDEVMVDDVLLRYQDGEMKSLSEGIVSEMNDAYVSIVHPDDLWIQMEIEDTYVELLHLEQGVEVNGNLGKVAKIGKVANYHDGKNYFDVFVECSEHFRLYEEVNVKMCVQSFHDVYRVPMQAVIRCKQKDYVIKQSWLMDTYEMDIDDIVLVEVVGVEDGFVIVRSEDSLRENVCVFDGISLEFIQKMLEMYV